MDFDKIVDLIDNLPYCPFCNTEPVTETNWDENEQPEIMVSCSNEECPAGQNWVSVEKWSTRPPEDTIRKQLEIAVKALIKLQNESLTRNSVPFHIADEALAEIEEIK
jgi:hypothetical protein